jgi:site-specific DNA-adenine methylase
MDIKDVVAAIKRIEHTTYVEPYGGSVAVLLAKDPSRVEVYNDTLSNVVNFFRALRDRDLERARLFVDADIEQACKRLRSIQIEHLDPFEVMRRYDSEKTLHYVSVPSLELSAFLKTLKGKVIL